MKLTFLGTGTSYGVPYIACDCEVCTSTDARNKRLRCSILVEEGDLRVLVDTTPDLRYQFLRAGIQKIDCVFWTHLHNDHVIGLDDLRPITDRHGYLDGYANEETLNHLKRIFDYVFVEGREHGGFPRVRGNLLEPFQTVELPNLTITPIPIWHYKREIYAYKFQNESSTLIYSTDCSHISDESKNAMRNADILILDALRHEEHPAHFNIAQALQIVEEVKPKRALFTHIAHDLDYETTNAQLPANVQLAYDGLEIEL